MKTVYHLGLHKTGSTSLQMFLYRNQSRLAKAGFLFPPVTEEHWATLHDKDGESAPSLNAYMGHNGLAYRMIAEAVPGFDFPRVHEPMGAADQILASIHEKSVAHGAHTLIFCSEDLARASLMVPHVPRRFADRFGTEDVTLIAALRRPDSAIAAWQTQRLRFGHPFPPLHRDPATAWLGRIHFEYRAALEPWITTFPKAQLRLVPFRDLRAEGGSVAQFGPLSGLRLPQGLETPLDVNPGLPHALLEVARQGLEALPRTEARRFYAFLAEIAPQLDLPDDDEVELFAPDTRETLFLAFQDIHNWLCQITGRLPFFEDLEDMRRPRPHAIKAVTRALAPRLLEAAQDTNTSSQMRRVLAQP